MKALIRLTLLLVLSSLPLVAIADDTPDPAATRAEMMQKMMPSVMEQNLPGMGMRRGAPTDTPPCRQQSMGNGPMMMKMGLLPNRMEHDLYIDRAAELGLSDEQVTHLKKIRSDCRKDNIRTEAELKIARFDLADLEDENAAPEQMEQLVRQIKTFEGDIELRHLKAKAEARKVLTAEQLKKAEAGTSLEDLF